MTLTPLLAAAPAIQIHSLMAAAALIFSAAVVVLRKGTIRHRWLGRCAAGALVLTAGSSFWIHMHGGFSWIHVLSLVTLASVTAGLVALRRGNRRRHAGFMLGAVIGLVVAAAFTLTPGRILNAVLLGG